MVDFLTNVHREITPLSAQDSFMVFDRIKNFFDFPVHFHPEFELNLVINGEGIRRIVGDSIETITDYELVLVGPNLNHGWEQHECRKKNIHEITLQFNPNLFSNDFLSKSIMKPLKDMFQNASHGILFSEATTASHLTRLSKISKMDGIDYYIEVFSILYDLAISRNQRLLSTNTIALESFENSDKLKQLYDFVQENYVSKITLDDAAHLLNMSTVSVNRFLKKRVGKTFVDYLNDVRIGYASRWLIEKKDLSISEIAYMCGFNSIGHFNRIFRKIKGRNPTQYRSDFSGIKRVL